MEAEECCLQGDPGKPALLKLRSFPGVPEQQPPPQRLLSFANLSSSPVRCLWVNFEGDEASRKRFGWVL